MQMLCKISVGCSDVRCPVCNQGFLVYWTRSREISRAEQRQALQVALREQHATPDANDIHAAVFNLPDTPMPLPRRSPPAALLPSGAVPVYH